MKNIRILFGGDVCALLGLKMLQVTLPSLIKEENIDFVFVNGENVVEGSGVDVQTSKLFFDLGCDVITGGNHTLEKFAIRETFGENPRVLRPANLPFARGSGIVTVKKNEVNYTVINLMGRENMRPIDCPFQTVDTLLEKLEIKDSIILVDFHAESTVEKETLGFYLDGRVTFVTGTHTHTQTADEKILPEGTAYITDAGLVGSRYGVIGGRSKPTITRAVTQVPQRYEWDESGEAVFSGVIVEADPITKKAVSIKRLQIKNNIQ